MVVNIQKIVKQIALLLKVKPEDTKSKIPNSGVTSKILKLVKDSNSSLGPIHQEEIPLIQQWIEYVLVYAINTDNGQNSRIVLKDLNELLVTKTYLVSSRLTIADVLLFYVLKGVLESLTNIEKEQYLNVCRWFDNLQYDDLLKPNTKIIDFSSNYLATLVPVRH